ncbi:MAG: cold shock domain-containing protein [Vicinamibacterales bacterium]|nr:cold shock domain-containing protein [Vicinamibacterales bacterium]
MSKVLSGTIKRLVRERGFGFIRDGDQEWFFHRSSVDDFDQLNEGDRVSFKEEETSKGPRANRVRRDKGQDGHDRRDRPEPAGDSSQRLIGRIISIFPEKGFGFIGTGSSDSYFFNAVSMETAKGWASLEVGLDVEFTPSSTAMGPRASDVRVITV